MVGGLQNTFNVVFGVHLDWAGDDYKPNKLQVTFCGITLDPHSLQVHTYMQRARAVQTHCSISEHYMYRTVRLLLLHGT